MSATHFKLAAYLFMTIFAVADADAVVDENDVFLRRFVEI